MFQLYFFMSILDLKMVPLGAKWTKQSMLDILWLISHCSWNPSKLLFSKDQAGDDQLNLRFQMGVHNTMRDVRVTACLPETHCLEKQQQKVEISGWNSCVPGMIMAAVHPHYFGIQRIKIDYKVDDIAFSSIHFYFYRAKSQQMWFQGTWMTVQFKPISRAASLLSVWGEEWATSVS